MTRDDLNSSYAIIRHNVRTYVSAGVVEIISGKRKAELALEKLESCQDSADRHEGWRYFIERTALEPGMDPAEATRFRQTDLEARESKALQDSPNDGGAKLDPRTTSAFPGRS